MRIIESEVRYLPDETPTGVSPDYFNSVIAGYYHALREHEDFASYSEGVIVTPSEHTVCSGLLLEYRNKEAIELARARRPETEKDFDEVAEAVVMDLESIQEMEEYSNYLGLKESLLHANLCWVDTAMLWDSGDITFVNAPQVNLIESAGEWWTRGENVNFVSVKPKNEQIFIIYPSTGQEESYDEVAFFLLSRSHYKEEIKDFVRDVMHYEYR